MAETELEKALRESREREEKATKGPWLSDSRFPEYVYCDDELGSAVLTVEGIYTLQPSERRANLHFARDARTWEPRFREALVVAVEAVQEAKRIDPTFERYLTEINRILEGGVK